ncbi:MAG: hypothetical protein Q8R39_02935 [bacterium]|nr:hypothetical protein [bacterium]MDZ4284382.1 hypothetical protein [Patescibacteria group bacterium]
MQPVSDIIRAISKEILNPLIALMFALALVVFLWGLVEFIATNESDQGRTNGKKHMLWGVIGMTIMVGATAIIKIVTNTFGLPPPNF